MTQPLEFLEMAMSSKHARENDKADAVYNFRREGGCVYGDEDTGTMV